MSRRSSPSEHGFLGGLDALAFGALVLITGTLLIVNAWSVVDTRMAISAAAREAVRTVADAPSADLNDPGRRAALQQQAIAAAAVALREHGKDVAGFGAQDVRFLPLSDTPRCDWVDVSVTWSAPTIVLPFVGVFRDGIPVTVGYRERLDPYRDGLAGEADCV